MRSLREITKYAIGNIQPQVVIFLDIPLEVSLERIQNRNKFLKKQGLEIKDRFEESGKAFFERVHQGFQELANEFQLIKKINANQSIEKVANEVWMTIQQLLGK
jgi:dTMP kinase